VRVEDIQILGLQATADFRNAFHRDEEINVPTVNASNALQQSANPATIGCRRPWGRCSVRLAAAAGLTALLVGATAAIAGCSGSPTEAAPTPGAGARPTNEGPGVAPATPEPGITANPGDADSPDGRLIGVWLAGDECRNQYDVFSYEFLGDGTVIFTGTGDYSGTTTGRYSILGLSLTMSFADLGDGVNLVGGYSVVDDVLTLTEANDPGSCVLNRG
jgi:hypothetical protein